MFCKLSNRNVNEGDKEVDNNNINTSMTKDFLENFHLVFESSKENSQLKFYCPMIDANQLSYDGLIISLRDAVGHYCLSRRTWDEYTKNPMQLSYLAREKFRKLEENEGEIGELLLFSFLETDLGAPKLITKMELKTNPNMYFNGADGVHYLKLESGNYQLIFGESKVYPDLSKGISAALDSIKDFKNDAIKDDESGTTKGITFERGLINACITEETYSAEERDFIKSLIYPKSSKAYAVDTAFAVFILYNLEINPNDRKRSNEDFRKWLFAETRKNIAELFPSILKRVETRGLVGHSLYFYLVPFENMDITKKEVLKMVVE